MRGYLKATFVICLIIAFASCEGGKRKASDYLKEAEVAYKSGNFALAKLKIDSVKLLFPKAFNEIDAGFKMMQQVRLKENRRNITFCDSMLSVNYKVLNDMLTKFNYVRDDKYQEFGEYYPKVYTLGSNSSGIRSGVKERGTLFIESVLVGNPIKHNKIRVSTKSGEEAETLVVTADGLNYTFKTINNSFEIVRYVGADENNISQFIYTHNDQPMTVKFVGNRTVSLTLPKASIEGISNSFELSNLLLDIEQLKFEKERSETLIRYLESKSK